MEKGKLDAYLGFCIRARKIVFGVDNLEKQRKGVCLILSDGAIGPNSMKILIKAKEKFDCPLLVSEAGVLGERLHRPAVKAVAITDKNLASAILSVVHSEPQFKIYSGGND